MIRRHALQTMLAASALPVAAALRAQSATPSVAALLRLGGCALMLRHAQTVSGIGDPPQFRLDDCRTQRNLSNAGRDQSMRIGRWFAALDLRPTSVQSSAWCRCKDTASLAFGRFDVLTALNSTFDNRAAQSAQTEVLHKRLRSIAPGQFEVWVTHQVNISAMTQEAPSMGEAFVVSLDTPTAPAKLLARTTFN